MIPCSEEEYYYKLDNMVLAACTQVRKVFANRWKIETGEDWIDDTDHVQQFLKGHGAKVLKKAKSFQKKVLKSKCLNEWDIQLLYLTLQNLGEPDKYQQENDAVYNLKKMRNDLAHHKTKKVTQQEYDKSAAEFKLYMQSLGMMDAHIQEIVDKMGVTSSLKAAEAVAKLHEKGEEFLKKGQFNKALECYSEAVEMPSLLPVDRGMAYEKRAKCWLDAVKNIVSDEDKCDRALLDAIKAVNLNDDSWNAHFLTAKGYHLKNNLLKAKQHYQRSLSISPAQKQVQNDYEGCKILAAAQNRNDHLDPSLMPTSLQERIKKMEQETGVKMSKKEFLATYRSTGSICKGQTHVNQGHEFLNGWGVPQNLIKAAKCFAKAAVVRNAEGMYFLVYCYLHGHGVIQDVPEALRIFREVAAMKKDTEGNTTLLRCNVGVASAEHALGLSYQEGIGVERNYLEAAKWYKRAMEHGDGNAANNLGYLHHHGIGCPKDAKMAEYCLKEGMNLKSASASAGLVCLYLDQLEPEKAKKTAEIGLKMESGQLLRDYETRFKPMIALVTTKREAVEPEILEFERAHKLTTGGLNFRERFHRALGDLDPDMVKALKFFDDNMKNYLGDLTSHARNTRNLSKEEIFEIVWKAKMEGSYIAGGVVETLIGCSEIDTLLQNDTPLTRDKEREILDLLYTCVTLNPHLISLTQSSWKKLELIVTKWFHEECNIAGEVDMKVRFCYVVFNLCGALRSDDMYSVELLKEGIRRYPDNEYYYDYLSQVLGNKGKFQEAKCLVKQGLERFPDNENLLYALAVHMHKGQEHKHEECIFAYQNFLAEAPVEHRKVPEACYHIAALFLGLSSYPELSRSGYPETSFEKRKLFLRRAEIYFGQGQAAEKRQLSCHFPREDSQVKFFVKFHLKMKGRDSQDDETSNEFSSEVDQENILERKRYLQSPTRKSLTLEHREKFRKMVVMREIEKEWKCNADDGDIIQNFGSTFAPKLKQKAPMNMSLVKPITLGEMNPTEEYVFEDRVIDFVILEEANPHFTAITLIAEDDNKDVARLCIYNVDKSPENLKNFQPGCRIAIVNPYMRIGMADDINVIRNDEPRCVVYLEKIENMCRFCGEADAYYKCSKCKRPYCSRECQTLDWTMFQHKLICKLKWC